MTGKRLLLSETKLIFFWIGEPYPDRAKSQQPLCFRFNIGHMKVEVEATPDIAAAWWLDAGRKAQQPSSLGHR